MGDWKVILTKEKRLVKGVGGKDNRDANIYTIITNDKMNLILAEWEEVDAESGTLEIDGKWFKSFGQDLAYSKCPMFLINIMATEKRILSPDKDIKSLSDAIELYRKTNEEIQKLFSLVKS